MTKSIKSIAVFCSIFVATALSAQNSTLGKFSLSAGIGVLPTFLADNATVNTPPVFIRMTYQVTPSFNLGGYLGHSSSTSTSPFLISDGQQSLISNKMAMIGLRGEVKKRISNKFDIYGGALIGVNQSNKKEFDKFTGETIKRDQEEPTPYNPNASNIKFMYSGFVGTTFYLHKNFGCFAEVGYGITLFNTGITVRL